MEEVHVLPGRMRLKSPQLYDKKIAETMHIAIEKLIGVKYSRVNYYTSSVLIVYDIEKTDQVSIQEEIKDILKNIKEGKSLVLTQNKTYLSAIQNQKKARNRFLFYGSLYVLFKVKNALFGVFPISRHIRLLITASVITTVEGYPALKRFFKHISNKAPRLSDVLLRITAISLIFLREDGMGCLLLSFRYINDYLRYATEVEYLRILHQSIVENMDLVTIETLQGEKMLMPIADLRVGEKIHLQKGDILPTDGVIIEGKALIDGIYGTGQLSILEMMPQDQVHEGMRVLDGDIIIEVTNLPHKMERAYHAVEEMRIYQKVTNYQEGIGSFSIVLAFINYLVTGNLLNALGIVLLLCPTASELAVHTGMNSYLHLLGKHKIFLKRPAAIEKAAYINHVAFDKTGTLSQGKAEATMDTEFYPNDVPKDLIREDAYALINALKKQGITRLSLLTGDTASKANYAGEVLGIDNIYSECSREEKGKIIGELKTTDEIMMVGDGVNDLEAMRYADISVGLVSSSCDKVKLYSDCIIFEDDLYKVADFIQLSQRSYRAIEQHTNFSKMYNITLGILAVFIPFNPYTAKSLNTINSLLVLLLSKRIEYFNPKREYKLLHEGEVLG
ncbi:cation transport ATpase [Clostridium aceticum]|uniref:P-type Cu(+) transporter n=1 Tax=Clostridium aceticum TaxID=84022 RepID=A0A0D8ICQ0_9CLOT|nr:HAD-IC family P-type ATPase [Clostridium aceticum]AKL96395.1 cation transport ATpase [Clostridium aceticum]KJF26971.1 hypothetical protein TZ02_10625 [Clostridium aceticum]